MTILKNVTLDTEFQGGGCYDARGQLIRACVCNGDVYFIDQSRVIYGHFKPAIVPTTAQMLRDAVMARYMRNNYIPGMFWPWWQ